MIRTIKSVFVYLFMNPTSREQQIAELFPTMPRYRLDQCAGALFQPTFQNWNDVSSLPATMRQELEKTVPWISVKEIILQESKNKDTFKALLEVEGGGKIETVLMKNHRDYWTVCVSSQIGCAMRCSFCSTGKMGLTRNLSADEIIDQYRYWIQFLLKHPELEQRISNIVFMGMGEPLANYEHVKEAINTILEFTEIGNTRITVSTVGVLPRLEQILKDRDWPHVRLAVSLHSADPATRRSIVPSSYDDFIPKLTDWARRYLEHFGNRRHHLTFEYVMLHNVNDTPHDAKLLANLVNSIGNVRVNLIPYNFTGGEFKSSTEKTLNSFLAYLDAHQVAVTTRRTMGDDIDAACGQLYAETIKS